jgi:hypothetical protein
MGNSQQIGAINVADTTNSKDKIMIWISGLEL